MIRAFNAAAVLGAVVVLAVFASPTPAAKGVKKTQEHHIRGKVVSVQTVKGKKATPTSVTIQVSRHKHKKGQAAVGRGSMKTFQISTRTHVDAGKNAKTLGLAALRPGEHVTVFAHQNHADKVVIHQHKKKVA